MVLNRKFLLRAIVVTAAIFHALRVRKGKSLPLSVLSYLGHLSTQSFLGVFAGDLIGLVILSAVWRTLRRMSLKSFSTHKNEISDWLYGLGRMIPFVESKIQAEMDKQERGIKRSLIPEGVEYLHTLPKEGMSGEEIMKIMETMSAKEIQKWQSGRVSGDASFLFSIFSSFSASSFLIFLWYSSHSVTLSSINLTFFFPHRSPSLSLLHLSNFLSPRRRCLQWRGRSCPHYERGIQSLRRLQPSPSRSLAVTPKVRE